MDRAQFNRQLFFFLLAVLLPSVVLVVFGFVFLRQQTEIAENRAVEQRTALAQATGRELEDRLNDLAAQAAERLDSTSSAPRYPVGYGLLWMGRLDGQEFEPAWSFLPKKPPVSWGRLESAVEAAGRLEIRDRRFADAAVAYERLAGRTNDPRQRATAYQRAARTWLKGNRPERAAQNALQALKVPFEEQDEQGVPLAYYAVDNLLSMEVDSLREVALDRLRIDLDREDWFSPGLDYMVRVLLPAESDSILVAKGMERARQIEEVERLKSIVPGILRAGESGRWQGIGSWLVGSTLSADGPLSRHVFAFDLPALQGLLPEQVESVSFDGGERGLSLAPYLRDLRVELAPQESSLAMPRFFIVLGLGLLLGLTLFGGYLLWRDVRRETRLARLRAQFVSSVSHELRTPLTSIRMFADTLMAADDAPPEDRRRFLGIIANESERLTRMLNNVLNASRIEQGTMQYHMARGDVRDAVRAGVDAMQYAFDQEGVELRVEVPEEAIIAQHDHDAIEQAVLNLLTNALKYGGRKPVALTLSHNGTPECHIQVADQGPGIDPDEHERILERFYRTESAQNQRVAGAGLGLSLVSHIVEAHEGRIAIKSEPGEGSTFTIHLPTEAP